MTSEDNTARRPSLVRTGPNVMFDGYPAPRNSAPSDKDPDVESQHDTEGSDKQD